MKLSTRARYALRLMLDIAKQDESHGPVSLASVAERAELSKGYLEQLVHSLKVASLVKSVLGTKGGYVLTRPPEEITLREIIEAAIGPIRILDCLDTPEDCLRATTCECRIVYELVNKRITEAFDEFSLRDLMDPEILKNLKMQVGSVAHDG